MDHTYSFQRKAYILNGFDTFFSHFPTLFLDFPVIVVVFIVIDLL